MLSKSIGTNIKHFRTQKGFSQDDLAEKLYVTRQTISNYENGKFFPDIDTLQQIAMALEIELTWLLYGKLVSPRKKAGIRSTVIVVGIFAVVSLLTLILNTYTNNLKLNNLVAMPNILTRLVLVPFWSVLLGAVLLQVIDCIFGITKPTKIALKAGRIVISCVLGINLVIVLPYILWCLAVLWQIIFGNGSVTAFFPSIPVYENIAIATLTMMYRYPYVYALVGMALWFFYPSKRDGLNGK